MRGWRQRLRAAVVAQLLVLRLGSTIQLPATRASPATPAAPGKRRQKLPTRTATVQFVPTFKAAYRARGAAPLPAEHGAQLFRYEVSDVTPRHELVAMLHGLSSSGQLETASQLLDHALTVEARTDEQLASIVLNRCADLGRMDLCSSTLRSMRQRAVPLGALTFCILIKGHGRAGDVRLVRKTYVGMRKLRVAADLPLYNALVDAFVRNGKLADAEATLIEMDRAGVPPSARTFNTLLKGYAQMRQLNRAFAVVRRMREQLGASAPNQVTYNTLINACVLAGEMGRAQQIVHWLAQGAPRDGDAPRPPPSVQAYTTLIRGYVTPPQGEAAAAAWRASLARRGDPGGFGAAHGLLVEMGAAGVQPNTVTANTLLTAAFDARNMTAARLLAAALRGRAGATGDEGLAHATECAMIVGLCRPVPGGAEEEAGPAAGGLGRRRAERSRPRVAEALRRMLAVCEAPAAAAPGGSGRARAARRAARPSTRTCNALLSALVAVGDAQGAARVLGLMEAGAAAPPNAYSLCLGMVGHGQDGELAKAARLWARLRAQGWLDTVGLNAWLQCCVRAGALDKALQAFQQVKQDQPALAFDVITFSTLVRGLVHGRATRSASARALRLWAEMRQRGVAPDDTIVRDVLLACRRHLGIEAALRIRAELQGLGWTERRLAPHDDAIRQLLPPLQDIMANEAYWAELGVVAAPSLASEMGELTVCAGGGRELCTADGERAAEAQALAGPAAPAPSATEEIFERHGWNSVESSWSPFSF